MVDKVIGELPSISSLDATSLFVAEQSGQAVKVSGKQLTDFSNVETTAQVEQAKASAQAAKTAQEAAEAAILKSPIIQNGTWWVYNQTAGAYQDTGINATGPQGIPGPTSSVNGISPDGSGNITLTAGNVNAYSKTESDNLLQKKANASSVYTKSETYTKEETNTLLQKKADKDRVVNPNLLDNWYFGNPVDQRGGYVVPPDTSYYANDTGALVGTTDKYYTVGSRVSDKAYFAKDGAVYNVPISAVVRGYTGFGYTIDRWMNAYNPNNFAVLITDNGLAVSGSAIDGPFMMQRFERGFGGKLSGKTVTFSVLTTNGLYSGTAVFPVENTPDVPIVDNADIFMYFQWSQNSANLPCAVFVMRNADIKYIAAKLELGSHQTLAHQDENGNWVLNELPDYGEQLARCQRYQFEAFNRTITRQGYLANVKATNSTLAYGVLPTPVTMRDGGLPSLITDCSADNPYNAFGIYSTGYASAKGVITKIEVYSMMANGVVLKVTGSNFVAGNDYKIFISNQNTHQFLLDRNL